MMQRNKLEDFIKNVLDNRPKDWLDLTTHRLDIYSEELAKTEFLNNFENIFNNNSLDTASLKKLPTAYDYIRLGHPLSCVLEWTLGKLYQLKPENIISFSSETMPILAVLRTNLLANKKTQILYTNKLPSSFDIAKLKNVYGYQFEVQDIDSVSEIASFDGSTLLITAQSEISELELHSNIDFYINVYKNLGSVLLINGPNKSDYISEIQHVRRRETIAMTPSNCLSVLKSFAENTTLYVEKVDFEKNKTSVINAISNITKAYTKPLIGSSGLSVQYAIMMGLIDYAQENFADKAIKFVVPPNCYGGTNDQARRVAACAKNVSIVDLPVDGDNDMVQSIHKVLDTIAKEDAIPFIIAEIPTNPRVEVPDLLKLEAALSKERKTTNGKVAIAPVFILDQTFCPNFNFLGDGEILSNVSTISYASGSKFPSGGKCTAGYVVGNQKTASFVDKIATHLTICNNEATAHQMEILATQLPSMNQRIKEAYENTRAFVNYIQKTLPTAKINFVSEELAEEGFTPSVFSLDLPTKGNSVAEKESYKRKLNHQLINKMITEIPDESKYCVSYGQLKGCYWTIPATSTQGTTKEGDKDYIARVSVSPNLDIEKHKKVFLEFVKRI